MYVEFRDTLYMYNIFYEGKIFAIIINFIAPIVKTSTYILQLSFLLTLIHYFVVYTNLHHVTSGFDVHNLLQFIYFSI